MKEELPDTVHLKENTEIGYGGEENKCCPYPQIPHFFKEFS